MKNTIKYALFGAVLAVFGSAYAEVPNCQKVSDIVKQAVASQPEKVLEVVASQIAQNESCACEIVKSAIIASEADKALVARIVETAREVAPDTLRMVGQCAVAVAPDALAEVQTVVAKYAAVSGDSGYSAKGGTEKGGTEKGGKEVIPTPTPIASNNPLDFPGGANQTPQGPLPNTPGGYPLFEHPYSLLPPPNGATPDATVSVPAHK